MNHHNFLKWSFVSGVAFCYLTSGIVVVAGVLGVTVFRFPVPGAAGEDMIGRFAAGDGLWYASIARQGYEHDGGLFHDVAFFPAFPYCGRWLARAVPLRTELALLVVANCFLLGAFVVAAAFMRSRYSDRSPEVTDYTLLALGLLPTTFFFRMAYAESMLLFLMISVLFGMMRGWPSGILALLIGLATATRPVGIAFLPPFALYLWRLSPTAASSTKHFMVPIRRSLCALPFLVLSCWGLIAFMVFQWIEFSDPLRFAKSQLHARVTLAPDASVVRELLGESMLEPIWQRMSRPNWSIGGDMTCWETPCSVFASLTRFTSSARLYSSPLVGERSGSTNMKSCSRSGCC